MKYPQLNQLRSQLLTAGYSPTYISRLCGELEDHYQSVIEENGNGRNSTDQPVADDHALQRIGTSSEVMAAVMQTPELTPLVRRYPLVAFVLAPGLLLSVFTCGLVILAYLVAQTKTEFLGRELLIRRFDYVSAALLALMTVGFVGTALRFKCRWIFPFFAAGIFSLCGFYQIDIAGCAASGGTYFGSDWGFSMWKFVAPWMGLSLVVGATVLIKSLRSANARRVDDEHKAIESPKLASDSRRTRLVIPRPLTIAICFAAAILTFFFLVERARIATLVHPADNIVASINEPGSFRSLQLDLIAKGDTLDQLNIQPGKLEQARAVVANYEAETKKIAEQWRSLHPPWQMMNTSLFIDPIERAYCEIEALLTDVQKAHLEQLAYESLGLDILFRDEIRDRLAISSRQLTQLKDMLIEKIRQREELNTEIRNTEMPDIDQFRAKYRALKHRCDNRMTNVLSQRQLTRLNAIRGINRDTELVTVAPKR